MGLFGRKHRIIADVIDDWLYTDQVRWEPLRHAICRPLCGPAADMDDDGHAGECAYETIFATESVPGAEIAICAYAVEGQESYWRGIRYTYTTTAAPGWSFSLWEGDPYDQAYGSLGAADTGAADLALQIGRDPGWARAALSQIFDWDGRRFDTSIHASGEES